MTILSGIGGAIAGVGNVREWSITHGNTLNPGHASSTKQAPFRLKNNKDWTGSFNQYGVEPTLLPGYTGTFTGSVDGTNGVAGPVMIGSSTVNIDIEGGGYINVGSDFGGNGALTFGAAAAVDSTCPAMYSALDAKVMIGDPADDLSLIGNWEELDDVRSVTITLTRENGTYASSGTAGWMKRVMGNLDATLSINVYEAGPTNLLVPNTLYGVRVYINAEEYWEMLYMRLANVNDFGANVEAGNEVVGVTYDFGFSGWTLDSLDECVQGKIVTPGETLVWGAVEE